MKPLYAFVGLLLAAGAGALGGYIAAGPNHAPATSTLISDALPLTSSVAGTPNRDLAAIELRLDGLSRQIEELQQRRESGGREPAMVAEQAKTEELTTNAFVALHKDAIRKVFEEERAEEARKAEEDRKQRDLIASQKRAEGMATRFNLDAKQTKQLTDLYEVERAKQNELRNAMQNGTMPDGTNPRDAFTAFRDWRTQELTTTFGADLGGKINEADNQGFRGGPGGGPGGGGGGGRRGGDNGQGGNGQGGGQGPGGGN